MADFTENYRLGYYFFRDKSTITYMGNTYF